MKNLILIIFFISCINFIHAQSREVPFTLDDRDRIMRTEGEITSLKNEMNTRFEAVDKQFESQQKQLDRIYTLLFFILGGVFSLIGFVLWDRRTAITPVQRENRRIINALT